MTKLKQLNLQNEVVKGREWDNEEIRTDSLWIIDKRDNRYGSNKFHGNFISDIPYQMIIRFTKEGETVWDCFGGSGTTLDVGNVLKREIIINDLTPIREDIIQADSTTFNPGKMVQLLIMHPPYVSIIKFSDKEEDLSKVENPETFLLKFREVINNVIRYLERGRMLILVIGDCYLEGKYYPLGFYCAEIVKEKGFIYKAVIVKNFGETSGNKLYKGGLGRYRKLKGNFYDFSFEYVFVMEKC